MTMRIPCKLVFFAIVTAAILPGVTGAQNIVAHRGASHDAPENTLASMNLAWEQGADGVEADFYLTSDGKIICIHDPDTKRVAGVKHVVDQTTFDKLRQLDVGAWKHEKYRGERMPTLKEVAATVPPGKLFVIELKVGPEIVGPLVEDLKDVDLKPEQMIIICFKPETVAECERLLPQLKSYWLTDFKQQEDGSWKPSYDAVLDALQSSHADGLGAKAEGRVLDADFLKRLCGESYCDFHVWTVDDAEVARRYQKLGAWGITTNRPGWLRTQLQLAR
jgi:glycerophosphoryl diester phosphodiesterase